VLLRLGGCRGLVCGWLGLVLALEGRGEGKGYRGMQYYILSCRIILCRITFNFEEMRTIHWDDFRE
jgi:hypothetical protein